METLRGDGRPVRGSMAVAVVAGLLVLMTGPLAGAALLLLEGEGFEGLARLVNEGGVFSYVVLLTGALASLAAAVLLGVSVRRPGLPAPFALLPFLLPSLAALPGMAGGMSSSLAAISHASPLDRGLILCAAIGEVAALQLQALTFVAAGCLAVASGALLAVAGPGRAFKLATAVGAGALGLSLFASAAQTRALRGAYLAVAHASPADRMTLLADGVDRWSSWGQIATGLLLVCLVVAALVAVLLGRGQRTAALGVGLGLLVAAVGLRGSNVLAERQLRVPAQDRVRAPHEKLLTVEGRAPRHERAVKLERDELEALDAAVLRGWDRGDAWLSVELTTALTPARLLRALQTAHFVRLHVELIGDGPKRELPAPVVFETALDAVSSTTSAAPLRLLYTDEVCEACAGAAVLTKEGLAFTPTAGPAAAWSPGPIDARGDLDRLPGVELRWTGDVEALARASVIALAHAHLLTVRVPAPDPMPVVRER